VNPFTFKVRATPSFVDSLMWKSRKNMMYACGGFVVKSS
jgi:hypothetical protein